MACFRVHVIFSKSGVWVYPVLDVLNWWQRIVFYVVALCLQASLYFVGETLNKARWGKTYTYDYLTHSLLATQVYIFRIIKQS